MQWDVLQWPARGDGCNKCLNFGLMLRLRAVSYLNLNKTHIFLFFCLCFFFLFSFVTIAFSMKGNSAQPDSFRVVTIEPKELALGA